jgi:hypothetical protein
LAACVLLGLLAPASAGAASQTWVSGVGDDVNPCSRTAPSKTDAGGRISALDPGGFGTVTITKSITIDGAGMFAGVVTAGNSGIVVNAGAGADVVLRGITLDNVAPCSGAGAIHAIKFLSGRSLHVDRVAVRGFPGAAIDAEPSADGGSVTVSNSDLRDNCTAGVLARRAGGNVGLTLTRSFLAGNGTGVLAGDGSTVRITRNTVVANGVGLASESGGTLESFADNRVAGNGTDGAPTVTRRSPTPAPGPGPAPPSIPTPTPPPPGPGTFVRFCKVPSLIGRRLTSIRRALGRASCALGRVRYRVRRGKPLNRAYAQSPLAGTHRPVGSPISVTINGRPPIRRPKARQAFLGASRTWVSGVGDDANPCSRTAPCKTFAGALGKTSSGGIVDTLDPGEFGPITIDRSVVIDGSVSGATINVSPGVTGITVAAGPDEDVVLRNLAIVSVPACSAPGAGHGIRFVSGRRLHLEHVTIRGFAGSGISLEPGANRLVTVEGGHLADNCAAGISAQLPGGSVEATVDGATIVHNGTGVLAGDGSLIRLTGNTINGNGTGLGTAGTGAIQGWGDNAVGGNMTDGVTPILLALT